MTKEELVLIQKAIAGFILNATEKNAPKHAVQAFPEATRVLIELERIIQTRK